MIIESYSFLKKIIGRQTYNGIKDTANQVVPIATCVLILLLGLSLFVHWTFISSILSLITGYSLIFIAYIIGLIVWLDKGVDVALQKEYRGYAFPKKEPKGFKKTKVRGIMLVILGIVAIYFSNVYRKQYAFECDTFLVDHQKKTYHLDWDNDCEEAEMASRLEKMKGYQIDDSYTFCYWCEEWAEDAEAEYNANRFYRR